MKQSASIVVLLIIMAICGCGEAWANGMQSLPRGAYAVKSPCAILDKTLVEGKNQVVFADTPEERAKYIPKTKWREAEIAVGEEECSFKLIAVGDGMNDQEVSRFLSGDAENLQLRQGDYFVLEMDIPYWLSDMSISVVGNLAVVVTDQSMAKVYQELAFASSEIKAFDRPLLCKYLLVKAPDDGGAILRHLRAIGRPVFAGQILRTMEDSPVVLDAKDSRNPLSIWRQSLTGDYYRLAEKLLEGAGVLDDHQKIMVFMDYIADFYVGIQGKKKGFEEYIGECGSYSNLLAALACTQGISARILTLGNYPQNNGHSVCEVFYENQWHLFDPTYGAFYTLSPANETVHPYVLGFEELAQGRGDTSDVTCVVTTPCRLNSKGSYSFLGPRIYEEANPKGVIGPARPLIYPLAMEASASLHESTVLSENDFSAKYQGIRYIGAAGTNNMHRWTLNALERGKEYEFIIEGSFVGGERTETPFYAKASSVDAQIIDGQEHIFANGDNSSNEWKIRFVPESDKAIIMLTHDYRGPELFYVMFSSFELRRTDVE